MKTTFTTLAVLAAASTTDAFWDAGHETVGEIATQLMAKEDVKTLNDVLGRWDTQFPFTGEITTATMWPDLIKCSARNTGNCPSPLTPSLNTADDWHFVNIPANVDGSDWNGTTDPAALLKASVGGNGLNTLKNALGTFTKSGSNWSVNFMLRYTLHVFGDLHQPLHTVTGISSAFPTGDLGGNKYQFRQPCSAGSNLHAIWDSGANTYSVNWAPVVNDPNRALLAANATALITKFQGLEDKLNFKQYAALSWKDFSSAMSKTAYPAVIIESYGVARSVVYKNIDLTVGSDGKVACPTPEYLKTLLDTFEQRVYLGGSRLAVVLTQVAKQIRTMTLL
ncbi:hypothetical protein ACHHYP_16502 [Achlya hypogyna]|nr:hypothetical protein ACHHYP_16502 [Achlya hypogyna]